MPVDQVTVTQISCDNPSCPGNDLDPADRAGWVFVNYEVYGEPTQQAVFCSAACVSASSAAAENPEIFAVVPEPEASPV